MKTYLLKKKELKNMFFSKNDFLRLFKTLLRPLLPPKHPFKITLLRLAQKTSTFQQIIVAKALRKSGSPIRYGMTRFSDAGWEYDIPNGRNDQLLVQNGVQLRSQKWEKIDQMSARLPDCWFMKRRKKCHNGWMDISWQELENFRETKYLFVGQKRNSKRKTHNQIKFEYWSRQ